MPVGGACSRAAVRVRTHAGAAWSEAVQRGARACCMVVHRAGRAYTLDVPAQSFLPCVAAAGLPGA
ncbi:hypothetical protein AQ611_05675 [Burkholderia singularis]|nr:hypothetical protein AQ611_05675 [Burkholderia sp. Bp7605]